MTVGTPLNFDQGATNHLVYDNEKVEVLEDPEMVSLPIDLIVDLLDIVRAAKTSLRPELNSVNSFETSFSGLAHTMYYEKLVDINGILAEIVREYDRRTFEEEMGG